MKKRFTLPDESGSKKRAISKANCTTFLYEDDYTEFMRLRNAAGVSESKAIRLIVSDWIRMKKVMALGKEQVEDPVRRIYERVMDERIAPLVKTVEQLKDILDGSSGRNLIPKPGQESASGTGEIAAILSGLKEMKSLLAETGSSIAESAVEQMRQLEQMEQCQETMRSISCETFASSWSILDLLIRYVVEAGLRAQGESPTEVEKEAAGERRMLRTEGLQMIDRIEDFLKLPPRLRLARLVHASDSFPLSRIEPGQSNQLI